MHAGRRYSFFQIVFWSKNYLLIFIAFDAVVVLAYQLLDWNWLQIPWQPLSLIGIAVAFYLGFKNNSSYERLWEARKIWGGIVNASRSFTVMARDFISNDEVTNSISEEKLAEHRKRLVHRHVAWLYALTYELRKVKPWEHSSPEDTKTREDLNSAFDPSLFENLKPYINKADYEYVMTKGNRSSHLMSIQSKDMMALRRAGIIEHFRHLEMQALITEFYTLQGKSERIKNFPFPRQYASINYFFTIIFIALLPFGLLNVFSNLGASSLVWLTIPFSVLGSWVFWLMEMVGDFSENPFEGLHNDVPITSMARGIEIDIRQMLDEIDLPEPIAPNPEYQISI